MRLAMLYTADWSQEFRDYERGYVPSHRLFGAAELRTLGFTVATCRWGPVPGRLRRRQLWKLWQALWALATQNRLDCIVATTEASALPLLLMRRVGVLRAPIMVVAVAVLTDKYRLGTEGWLRRFLLRGASVVVVYARAQVRLVGDLLGLSEERVRFVPFGVDVDFFYPPPAPTEAEPLLDVLSVGTNEGKDFPTLVAALRPGERCLIVTDAKNREMVAAAPSAGSVTLDHDIPILRLRELYASSRRHVIPLRDVEFSCGQTVLLETLAMGRPVVVSDVISIRDYVVPGIATIVRPGDVSALRAALSQDAPAHVSAAAEHVREHFSSLSFAARLASLCREIAPLRTGTAEAFGEVQ